MKEVDQRKATKNSQTKRSGRTERRDPKLSQGNTRRTLNRKETKPKASSTKLDTSALVNGSNVGKEPSEVYENVVVHYVDDCNRSKEGTQDLNANIMVPEECTGGVVDDCSSDVEKKPKNENEEVSDSETIKDSVSSHADSVVTEDEKVERVGKDSKSIVKKTSRESIERSDSETTMSKSKPNTHTPNKSARSSGNASRDSANNASLNNSENSEVSPKPSPECSDDFDDKPREETKENDTLDEASNGTQSIESDNGSEENTENEDEAALEQKIEEMETKIEKLEEELREVAALEISLYSVVPQHGSSAHKVHTPARRLSRLYLHACKHWTLKKRGRIAKTTLSGLVLIAKSCANDVPRLTFWLSNTVMLREIISQTFGKSCSSSPLTRFIESHGNGNIGEVKATTAPKGNGNSFMQFVDGWQETGTFTAALQNVESWIYCRILESVWWQAFTPYMQSPVDDLSNSKNIGKLLGPTLGLGDQQQGSFSVNLWRNAFKNASQLLCPVRAAGHECGCLPVLARMVMEQCVSRLDVAMFNAILRESAHEIPTDPVSDPIIEPKVLPIPAGDLSFGSGAQLKNYVGNWSRWLTDLFDMDAGCASREDHHYGEDIDRLEGGGEPKPFILLNDLSDLLMLPKDMLIDRSIRNEVCPCISLPLVKRILCNFTPDEFCPYPVPGAVLEALNSESIVEQRFSEDSTRSFPYAAAPVVYTPPSAVVVVKIAEAGLSIIQRKGYTSDEELEELDCPLSSIVDQSTSSSNAVVGNVNGKYNVNGGHACINARYELLREVWSV